MTTYTRIKEEGKIEGKLEGKLEGKKESITEVILKGFDNNLDIVLLANITGQSEDQVRTILVKNHKIKI
jgi:predicted transposase YdaD